MIIEKEILLWNGTVGLSTDMVEVLKLEETEFPRLIFQDFMNQLKLPKIRIGFEQDSSQLIEIEPEGLEYIDDSVRFDLNGKNTLNLDDVLMYYMLCDLLKAEFKLTNLFTDNHLKSKLFFVSIIPFSAVQKQDLTFVKQVIKKMRRKQIQHVLERFFVLLGQQYKEKLVLFLTYLNQKYKFSLDKTAFVQSVLGEDNLMRVERDLNKIL